MALSGLFCADVPLRNYSLTHSADVGLNLVLCGGLLLVKVLIIDNLG